MKIFKLQNLPKQDLFSVKAATCYSLLEHTRAIAYSMDTLVPGFYVWFGALTIQIGGCTPDDQPYFYPGNLHSRYGCALVLPGYQILTTYKGTDEPGQAPN